MNWPLAWIVWAPLIVAALGAILMLSGIGHLLGRRMFKGGRGIVFGALIAAVGLAVALMGLNLQTYSRLNYERPLAEVSVHAVAPAEKRYQVAIRRLDGTDRTDACELQGDEWILSGRVLRWRPWANILGLDSMFTFDQVANKYYSAAEANGKPITACDVEAPPPAANRYVPSRWLAWLMSLPSAEERRFGSANYMPLADGAVYTVVMTQAGLNSEPANDVARAANAAR